MQHMQREGYSSIANLEEQVNSFLEIYDIEATFIDPNWVYGYFDEVTGKWTGMIGHVSLTHGKKALYFFPLH